MDTTVMEQLRLALVDCYPETASFLRILHQLHRLDWVAKGLTEPDLGSPEHAIRLGFVLRGITADGAMDRLLDAVAAEHPDNQAVQAVRARWQAEWEADRGLRELDPQAVYAHVRTALQALVDPLAAIEASWNGDSVGWFVILSGIITVGSAPVQYGERRLLNLRGGGGDMRLINGHIPPWPEARVASEVGTRLAKEWGVPFYFASPEKPDDTCPRWWERDQS